MITLYIAGPMSGYKDRNYPLFNEVEARLVKADYNVLNPARIDAQFPMGDGEPERTWDWYMRRALVMLCEGADGIALLPGWQHSRGALLEERVGRGLGMRIQTWYEWAAHNPPLPLRTPKNPPLYNGDRDPAIPPYTPHYPGRLP